MKPRTTTRILVIITVVALSVSASCDPAPSGELPPSQYLIYSTVLKHIQQDAVLQGPVIVDPRTYSLASPDSFSAQWHGSEEMSVGEGAVSAFREANQHAVTLVDSFATARPAQLLSHPHQRYRESGTPIWPVLRREFGDGVVMVRFSRPGIDMAEGEALLYYTFICGPSMCAQGHHVRLRRSGDEWVVDAEVLAWIS